MIINQKSKIKNQNYRAHAGLSILEILVAMGIFAVIGILTTRAISLSLHGSRKSESLVKVRENVNYALAVIERQLRNAETITTCDSVDLTTIAYLDQNGVAASFSCADGRIASGSAYLTSDEVNVTSCSFVCSQGSAASPPQIRINIVARSVGEETSVNESTITVATAIDLRTY